jgi:hypothetical protein
MPKVALKLSHYYLMKSWNAIEMRFVWDINPIKHIIYMIKCPCVKGSG